MKLTETQAKYYKAGQWLLGDGPRADGRTTLMATIFVQQALADPGYWIDVWDHNKGPRPNHHLFETIYKVFDSLVISESYEISISTGDSKIKISERKNKNENPYLDPHFDGSI